VETTERFCAHKETEILGKAVKPDIAGQVRKWRKGRANWNESIHACRKEK